MIKLWKDETKNKKLRDIIAAERRCSHPAHWRRCNKEEKIQDIMKWYDCPRSVAEKVIWIICGDYLRQVQIYKTLGKEYTKYDICYR